MTISPFGVRRPAGVGIDLTPGEVRAGDRRVVLHEFRGGALEDDLPAVFARSGSEIDDPVRRSNRLFIVFDHDDRVAEIAKSSPAC